MQALQLFGDRDLRLGEVRPPSAPAAGAITIRVEMPEVMSAQPNILRPPMYRTDPRLGIEVGNHGAGAGYKIAL